MREALEKSRLQAVYNRVANHYDVQHSLLTAKTDQRGRELLIEDAVHAGDTVLDCGTGTGTTGLMAARKVGATGRVVMFDLSEGMLDVAREKAAHANPPCPFEFQTGDMVHLPFKDGQFDVVLSTYSLCPVYDPAKAAMELYRVTKPGGRIGVAHSAEPAKAWVRRLADLVENVAWHIPSLSLGCRVVSVLPTLKGLGCEVRFEKRFGVPLWPFLVFVVEKPSA